jgi:hypothetical protein
MVNILAMKTITEPAREIKVCREADVVVVGAGPGGIGAAVAAARNGADTVLIERYGHLGGMATGGLVTIIPNLTDITGKQQIAGICQEWVERLDVRGAAGYPPRELWGSDDKELVKDYFNRIFFFVRQNRVCLSVTVDAEILKCILNDMIEELKIKTYLHSWGTAPIMEGKAVKGVIFESKSGRQAVLAKVVIDATGDGDLLPGTGAQFETDVPPSFRVANLALCFWIANVDLNKADDFKLAHPDLFLQQSQELVRLGGYPSYLKSNLKNQESVVWTHNKFPNSSQTDVEELTRVEFEGRKKMLTTFDYRKKHTPGFENSFIALTAPQIGTRGSRRVIGEYQLTQADLQKEAIFEDTIAVFPDLDRGEASAKHPLMYIPYRSLVPRGVDNLLVACRAFSSDAVVQEYFNLIPHCIAFGEAAGTAAALAIKDNLKVKDINIPRLQKALSDRGVILPELAKTRI